MELWQKAFPGEGEVDPEEKKAVTQMCEFLSNMCNMIEWPICNKHIKCTKPNERRNPDVVVWIPPTDETTLPIPLLIVKIVGRKDVWGSGEAQYKGWAATLVGMAIIPIAYYMEMTKKDIIL